MSKALDKTLDKKIRTLIKERNDAESDLDIAVTLIEWITDLPMTEDERRYRFTSWAAFNDCVDGGKFHWKFLKDCGLLGDDHKRAKIEYEFYKERWVRR